MGLLGLRSCRGLLDMVDVQPWLKSIKSIRDGGLPRNISVHTSVPCFTMPAFMHGRIVVLLISVAALGMAAAPAAQADQILGLAQPSAADGVVTAWRIQAAAP